MPAPWDTSFEDFFNEPDREFPNLVEWLMSLDAAEEHNLDDFGVRMTPNPWTRDQRRRLAVCMASLLARSPGTRHLIRCTTEYYRDRMGLADPTASKMLIAANQSGLFDFYAQIMEKRGRFLILFTDHRELIFGDGVFHNFPTIISSYASDLKAICHILPTVAVAYTCPISYALDASLPAMRLANEEVALLNESVLVYSKDFVFYRSQRPPIPDAFLRAEHLQFAFHQQPWIDRLLYDVAQYRSRTV